VHGEFAGESGDSLTEGKYHDLIGGSWTHTVSNRIFSSSFHTSNTILHRKHMYRYYGWHKYSMLIWTQVDKQKISIFRASHHYVLKGLSRKTPTRIVEQLISPSIAVKDSSYSYAYRLRVCLLRIVFGTTKLKAVFEVSHWQICTVAVVHFIKLTI